ncbi:MAG TPA: chemotaxis protein CheB, partial [Nodosilinea sp.]|nr:chemotaxis protein CheB [Nodosilinea sp.]
IVVIGASAGGVEALNQLVEQLPPRLSAAIFVALHFPAGSASFLPEILSRARTLPAVHPQNGEKIQPGRIYVAPPDYHLLIRPDTIELSRGPKENGYRPAIDTMFRSAAQAHGPSVVGVVLTGMLDDGTWGLKAIKSQGGVALAQDPEEAMFRSMPDNAIAHVDIDQVLPLNALANRIVDLVADTFVADTVENLPMTDNRPETEGEVLAQEKASAEQGKRPNAASPITCPDCGGVLWELQDSSNILRFRCHIGHAYSLDSLMTEQGATLERALWTAVRAIEEKAALSRRLTAFAQEQNRPKSAEQFSKRAAEAEQNSRLIRQLILNQQEIRLQANTTPEQVQSE